MRGPRNWTYWRHPDPTWPGLVDEIQRLPERVRETLGFHLDQRRRNPELTGSDPQPRPGFRYFRCESEEWWALVYVESGAGWLALTVEPCSGPEPGREEVRRWLGSAQWRADHQG